jgi:hypothetical protein
VLSHGVAEFISFSGNAYDMRTLGSQRFVIRIFSLDPTSPKSHDCRHHEVAV